MLECLNNTFKPNVPKPRRQAMAAKSAEWQMIDKANKAILILAFNETEVPADDSDDSAPRRPMAGSRRMRQRRGGRGGSAGGPLEWLPSAEEVLIPGSGSDAFRLAVLIVNKTLNKDDWSEDWDATEASLRDSCLSSGVHPAWVVVGEKTPLLGIFAGFPKAEISEEASADVDFSNMQIDVEDSQSLSSTIDSLSSLVTDAEGQVALRKVISQLNAGRALNVPTELLNLEGKASAISVLLNLASGQDPANSLALFAKEEKDLAAQYEDYHALMTGQVNDWKASISTSGEDALSTRRRQLAWQNAPEDAAAMSSEELQAGLTVLQSCDSLPAQVEKLQWWRLSALTREGAGDEAIEALLSLSLDVHADLTSLIPLLTQLDERAMEWLDCQVAVLDEAALKQIIVAEELDSGVRNSAAKRLQGLGGEEWNEVIAVVIDLYTRSMDLRRLAQILTEDQVQAVANPYQTLLVSHLLAAGKENQLWHDARAARSAALKSIHGEECPEVLSSTSEALLMLLEGKHVEDDRITELLDKPGLLAFGQVRQALRDGGSGLADATNLDKLESSIKEAELSVVERNLFEAVIYTLRLNRVSVMLQNGDKNDSTITTLNNLFDNAEIPTGMIHTVRHLVLEHDLGLPSLVAWYQANDPLSPWHTLARAAVSAANGDELNAARDYRRAGDHEDFDYEHSIMLYRKSLIHLAFAEQWKEAVDLLEAQPALKTALTQRFQLYLRVSFTARQQKTDQASRMLKDFTRRTKMVSEENADGEMVEVERSYFAEEELDMLKTYHLEHPRPLPSEPFSGRVTAALNTIARSRRRQRNSFDNRFNQLLQTSPSTLDVYELASEAAEERPLDGLMFLERAQNSGKFSTTDLRRLGETERTLFAQYKNQIPTASRRYLRHLKLKPLIMIDTNVLIDELIDRVAEKLEMASEASLDITGFGRFHKVLLSRAQEGRVHLWIPKVVRQELTEIANGLDVLRARFSDVLVAPDIVDSVICEEVVSELRDSILEDFNTWRPLDLHLEQEAESEELKEAVSQFLLDYTDIYEELTAMKRTRGEPLRTVMNGKDVYPEIADKALMRIAMALAQRPLPDVGTVLVATRDGDFTLVARAVEERFGFGVAKNSRTLNAWLR